MNKCIWFGFAMTWVAFVACDRSSAKQSPTDAPLVPARATLTNDVVDADVFVDAGVSVEDASTDAAPVTEIDDGGAKEPCPANMAILPAGSFRLGENGRRVNVSAFCIDKQEVTVAAYAQCVKDKACSPRCLEENRCSAVPLDTEWGDTTEDQKASRRCNGGIVGNEAHPVNCVSYEEATAYCAAYGKRLPREEEWEWAARGGPKAMRYPWGQLDAKADELCWSRLHKGRPFKRGGTCVGGSFPLDTTPQGIQDMAGNVSEWVIGTEGGRTYPALRGASFWAVDDGYVKAALWGFDSPAKRSEIFGVRCARDAHLAAPTHSSDGAR